MHYVSILEANALREYAVPKLQITNLPNTVKETVTSERTPTFSLQTFP